MRAAVCYQINDEYDCQTCHDESDCLHSHDEYDCLHSHDEYDCLVCDGFRYGHIEGHISD